MKRILIVMLSLGLITAIAMPAAAVDVKVSGQYYVQGMIADNPSLLDKSTQFANDPSWGSGTYSATDNRMNRSAAKMYDQRLRVNTEFKIQDGLKLVTRFDALETMWGSTAWSGWTNPATQQQTEGRLSNGSNSAYASQNINFSRAYIDATTGIGQFLVGFQNFTSWGNNWVTTNGTYPGIKYIGKAGPFTGMLAIEKRQEYANDLYQGGAGPAIGRGMDTTKDIYDAGFIYKFKQGQAGLLWQYARSPQYKYSNGVAAGGLGGGWLSTTSILLPTVKWTIGNLLLEADGLYIFGSLRKYEDQTAAAAAGQKDIDATQLGGQVHARYSIKPVAIGAKFLYASGDDMQDPGKVTGSLVQALNGNYSKNDTLIMWNSDYIAAMGPMFGNMTKTSANPRTGEAYYNSYFLDNAWFYQLYADVTPMAKMNIHAALSYATADKKPKNAVGTVGSTVGGVTVTEFVSDKYGTEFDLTVSYKIFDNLEYMVGAGYLWAGDYFKGYDANAKIKDNYLLTHKLTLTF